MLKTLLLCGAAACVPLVAQPIQLVQETGLKDYGGVPFLADLTGDGRNEFLWLQSPGMFYSKVYDRPPYAGRFAFSQEELTHFCLTATDTKGKILWRVGQPWRGTRPFVTHSSERSLAVADLDGDGKPEVAVIRRGALVILDGRTGTERRSAALESDNMQIVLAARTGSGPRDWTLLVKNAEAAYPPHEYGNPAFFYSPDLKVRKKADYLGAGHTPRAQDLDGDGLDEFLIGFNRIGPRLQTAWSFRPVPDAEWNPLEMHVDAMAVGELQGQPAIAYAASNQTFALTAGRGSLLWKRPSSHPQQPQIGRFVAGGGNQVLIVNKRGTLDLVDENGKELWSWDPPAHFPAGRSPHAAGRFHVFDPAVLLPRTGPEGTDTVAYSDNGWPYLVDGKGTLYRTFPHTPNTAQEFGKVPGRPDDYGYGYYVRVDTTASTPDAWRVVINDRRWMWVYSVARSR
ncbi:MAG: hypothetical protein IPM24_27040 [Bryobacterales bacterium]|nr:hypothetical protein [Bryobacterales bacterium]